MVLEDVAEEVTWETRMGLWGASHRKTGEGVFYAEGQSVQRSWGENKSSRLKDGGRETTAPRNY